MPRRWGQRSSNANATAVDAEQIVKGVDVGDFACDCDQKARRPDGSVEDPVVSVHSAPGGVGSRSQFIRESSTEKFRGPRKVWWFEKGGQRHDATLSLNDAVPEHEMSEAAAEYRLRIRLQYLRLQGLSKEEIAREVQRALGWVTRWWDKTPTEVPRPREVPPYVAEYNLRMLACGVEPFRPAVLCRRYVEDTDGLYLECAQAMPWRQAVFRKRNYETGEVTVTNIASSRQDCSYRGLHTGIPRLDNALDRIRRQFNVKDPRAYLLNNFYPDGNTSIAPHQHDFWSAILSFGASRVFTLDGHPVLLGDGDLLVFGTQRHGVPKMPAVKDGRISVAIFWYPEEALRDSERCAECGLDCELLQAADNGRMYCEDCWRSWNSRSTALRAGVQAQMSSDTLMQAVPGGFDDMEEDMQLQAALQLSMMDF
eukprot:TRINITY_DN90303_c0_g1_i1.p1 TRINITY_DN90303_c0_g1~~TRINITY_DN90303_c0_g1_i1.p1  ORF type:complete len:425 (-),score=60.44 TRINITY_DN90303_c0_g1_i1:254-1528(-)